MKDGESEFEVKFGVTPFFVVPKIEHRRFSALPCIKKPGIRTKVSQAQTGPKGQKDRTKLPEGPVHKDQAGPKGQYIRTKLARRARKSGPNWPEEPVSQEQTKSETRSRNSKVEMETRNRNSK